MSTFLTRLHPERTIDDFSVLDGTVRFYSFVKAAMVAVDAREVLDFGAGRGAALTDDTSRYRRQLRDLRTGGARVTACDVDETVRGHPASDRQVVIKPGAPLPFQTSAFDVIVSDMTFEHIADAKFVADELMRVLRPGGYICARTPNRAGYVRIASSLVPNSFHTRLLRFVQPGRKSEDVFPTFYRMNSERQVQALFAPCSIVSVYDNAEPAYFFGYSALYRSLRGLHAVLPRRLSTAVYFYIHKPMLAAPKLAATVGSSR